MCQNREESSRNEKHYSFFQNTDCEYFPCHSIADPAQFNCLFCYCPLYTLGPHCGGNFHYTGKGVKDCKDCVIPHLRDNYTLITGKYSEIAAMMRRMKEQEEACRVSGQTNQQGESGFPVPERSCPLQDTEKAIEGMEDQAENQTREQTKKQVENQTGEQAEDRAENQTGKQTEGRAENQTENLAEKPAENRKNVIVMMACTERGFETMRRSAAVFREQLPDAEILQTGRCAHVTGAEDGPKLSDVTEKWFYKADALVFFAAAGIAVRCIAPFAKDKFRDPAVLVIDENGSFVISLLSGHAGGANRLCRILAKTLGAQPVITTATDGQGLFAVDVYAMENGLQISDRAIAKEISSRLLAGGSAAIYYDEDLIADRRNLPYGKYEAPEKYGKGIVRTADPRDADIIVSCMRKPEGRRDALYLIPRIVSLGIGCRKGIGSEAIEKAVSQILQKTGVFRQSLFGIASVDLKKEETGLHSFAEKWGLPLMFYTARELNEIPGTFSVSAFVRDITGVDCVCERSAVRLAGKAAVLLEKKYSLEGVTAALAVGGEKQSIP